MSSVDKHVAERLERVLDMQKKRVEAMKGQKRFY